VAGKVRSRSHRYTLAEAARIWVAAGDLGRRGALLRFMLLTGCRRAEAQLVEWAHLVLEDPVVGPHWNQPAPLTKNRKPHRVPLVPAAVALLRWLPARKPRRTGVSPLVFAGRGGKPVGDWTVIRRTMLERAGLDTGTLHDFRRTLVSELGDHGFDVQVADSLLNHSAAATMGGVMGVYQRSELWVKRVEALNRWADLLLEQVAALAKLPPGPAAWGFDQPFTEARIVRPERKGTRAQAKAKRKRAA
jgi:integrase